jgi:DNA-binding NarL/FixJ family response regulator
MSAPPDLLEQMALETMAIASASKDTSLQAVVLAFLGMARVSLGRVALGMSSLDEAMAVALSGEVDNFMAISEIHCVMLSACELAGDLVRCEQWCHAASEFARRYHCSFLSAYCRTTYGSLLTATGRWQEADSVLQEAIALFSAGHRGLRIHAVLKLADLRIYQGRLEEAEVLLAGYEDQEAARLPLARLHQAKGEVELARALLEQGLRSTAGATLHRAPLLVLLVEVLLLLDRADAAYQAAEEVATLAQETESDFLSAQAELAKGQVKRHSGDADAALHFEAALTRLQHYEQSMLAGKARLEMAQLLQTRDWAGAVTWARAALATFERVGARYHVELAIRLLRTLGVTARPSPRLHEPLTQRENEVLSLLASGQTNREIAKRLVISLKTVEHHVSQILNKLGLRSRTEAAAFVAGHLHQESLD